MAGLKEIKRRLRSVSNTRKITYAMKLVSAAKLKRAQEAVTSFRTYRGELDRLIAQVQSGARQFSDPLLLPHTETKNICLLIVGGQRGLCGGYNSSLHKKIEAFIRERQAAQPELQIEAFVIGKKVADHFRRVKRSFIKSYEAQAENVQTWPLEEITLELQRGFLSGRFDEVWLVYTRFKSVISQSPLSEKLLPLDLTENLQGNGTMVEAALPLSTVYEPSRAQVFSALLPRVINARIRQACLDAKASETGSRMTAMDAATRNAGELSRKLELKHNKLRQGRITSELLDIVGGSEAIK